MTPPRPDTDQPPPDTDVPGAPPTPVDRRPRPAASRLFGPDAPPSPGLTMLADLMHNHLDAGYAAAARRRERQEPPSALTRRIRSTLTLACVVAIGVVLAMAYQETVATAPDAARTRHALLDEVRDRRERTDELQRRADTLREQVSDAQDAAVSDHADGRVLASDVRDTEVLTGLLAVRGPGVVLEVRDGAAQTDPVTGEPVGDPELARVQDRDLQRLVNALWAAGAEAVAVDGQRLTPLSAIRSAGAAILVDFRPVDNPYTIAAIGDQDTLYRRFLQSTAARQFQIYIRDYEMGLTIRRDDEIRLRAGPQPELRRADPPGATGTPSPVPSGSAPSGSAPSGSTPSGQARPSPGPASSRPTDVLPSSDGGDR